MSICVCVYLIHIIAITETDMNMISETYFAQILEIGTGFRNKHIIET